MTKNTYPAWQETIRNAQVQQAEIDAEIDRLEAERKAADDAKEGRNLARALDVVFGIKVEPPKANKLILDGFEFWLGTGSFKEYEKAAIHSAHVARTAVVNEAAPTVRYISFGLHVARVKPEGVDWEVWPLKYIEVSNRVIPQVDDILGDAAVDEQWRELRASLATRLDQLMSESERALQQIAAYKLDESLNPPKQARITVETVLRSLIRDVVEAVLEERQGEF